MVSAMLEAGCDTSVKMGIPATVTPVNLATDLGLEDIIELLSKASISWQFCQFSLSCCFISWNILCTAKIIGQLSLITCVQSPIPLPCEKRKQKELLSKGVRLQWWWCFKGRGELEWHSKCPLTTPWVEVHYGGLQTLTLFTVSQKTTQKNLHKNRDPFFITLIHFISHEE